MVPLGNEGQEATGMKATILSDGQELELELVQDLDRWRWICNGEDTEVSGRSSDEALQAGSISWKFFNFRLVE